MCSRLAFCSLVFPYLANTTYCTRNILKDLVLLIFSNKLGGNVDIINGLNHYIGMKSLHTRTFLNLHSSIYYRSFCIGTFILVALREKKWLLYFVFALFVCFGVIAMIDFWRWDYNYGHNLNPDAAIIVPGMAYQPPLIGYKQLLNFGAYSIPHIGGWLFIGVGVILIGTGNFWDG